MARPPQLTCGAIRFATIQWLERSERGALPRGPEIWIWRRLPCWATFWSGRKRHGQKSGFKFVILTRRSSEIQRMTLFG